MTLQVEYKLQSLSILLYCSQKRKFYAFSTACADNFSKIFFFFLNVKTFSFDLVAFALTDWSRMSPVFKVSFAGYKPLD